jgi:hypothetical protein
MDGLSELVELLDTNSTGGSWGFHQWRIPNSWMIYDGKSNG